MEPIAIIGIGCRFPGAPNVAAFWQLLRAGINAVGEIPSARWDADALFDSRRTARGKMTSRWGGFLEDISGFDAAFVGISASEAATLDPQQRLLLETAWEAFADAGQPVDLLAGSRTGVFVGIAPGDYGRLALRDLNLIEPHTNTGNFLSIAANRISYFFDLHGPSIAIDTACSSSLVAVHLACQSIYNDECDTALAGGVNIICSPEISIGLSKAGALSPDGACKAFDARANGYVRGEGAGLIVLKPLAKATADGDYIYAVILGSAINQNGRTNGLTAPSRKGQEAVLREACRRAEVCPEHVQYVEAHGSGTVLGDLIEAEALGAVYGVTRSNDDFCLIGSVKTNIGHLETAAGIAGLIKLALSLKHREIPASLHFEEPNPHIRFDDYHLRVQAQLSPWPNPRDRALAAISSFAFGGTNAHMIVAECPFTRGSAVSRIESETLALTYILPISARSLNALHSLAKEYLKLVSLESCGIAASLYDLCYAASVKQSHHDHRLAFLFHTREQLKRQIEDYLEGSDTVTPGRKHPNRARKIALIFSEQAMSTSRLRPHWEYVSLLWPQAPECDRAFKKHAGFILQIAIADLWRSWGISPAAVVGDSLGEIAALYFTGVLSLQDALRVLENEGGELKNGLLEEAKAQLGSKKIQVFSPTFKGGENGNRRENIQIEGAFSLQHTVSQLANHGYDTFLEAWPTARLDDLGRQLPQPTQVAIVSPAIYGETSEAMLLEPVRKLYLLGCDIKWSNLFTERGRHISLPLYPWQRKHHWLRTR